MFVKKSTDDLIAITILIAFLMENLIIFIIICIISIVTLLWAYNAETKFDYGSQGPSLISKLLFPKLYKKKRIIKERIIKENYKLFHDISDNIIDKNLNQLAIQREKTLIKDSYGKYDSNKWLNKEIPYFIDNHIIPELSKENVGLYPLLVLYLIDKIEFKVRNVKLPFLEYNDKMTGLEFEFYCSDKLKKEGWKTEITKSSCDQGVDVIIQKGNRKIGIQCKKHSKPIGNKAVQEVKAGLNYYKLDEGVVIGNTSFTKSAIELAQMNKIKLLHFLETYKI